MGCRIDDYIDRIIYFFGIWEPNLTHFTTKAIKPGDVVVDVGANIGYFTLLMSRLVQKDGVVLAIEASPTTFSKLMKNVERNACANIIGRQVAVSDHKGEIALFQSQWGDQDTGKATIVSDRNWASKAHSPVPVQCDTFVNILAGAVPLDRVSFIKVDIEGAEAPLLAEIIEHRDRFAPRFVVVSEIGEANASFVDTFRSHGFQCFFLDNDYSYEGYLGVSSQNEGKLGGIHPLGKNGAWPPTADLVFVYDRGTNN